jgi:VanZ family protein
MGLIHLLSSIPDHGAPQNLAERLLQWATPGFQNLLHIPLFGGLAATWYWALRPAFPKIMPPIIFAFLISGAYSFMDEWHQMYVPGRFASLTDVAFNLIGIASALSLIALKYSDSGRQAS